MIRSGCLAALLFFLAFRPGTATAQLPTPRLSAVFPPGGQVGSTVEVAVSGSDLDEVSGLLFSETNLVAQPKLNAAGKAETNRFNVAIGPGVRAGVYEVRVLGRNGISNPRAFVVDTLPEIIGPSTNTTQASAAGVPNGGVVNGRGRANGVEWFKFPMARGQRLLVECAGVEIDSRMDASMLLHGPDGVEVARARHGEVLDYTAPEAGGYFLKLHDGQFRGGDDFYYRLRMSARPRIDFILPAAGQPGRKSRHQVYGRNLPGGKPSGFQVNGREIEQVEVEIDFPTTPAVPLARLPPGAVGLEGFNYRLASPGGESNPFFLGFATAPVTRESGERVGEAVVPGDISGQLAGPGPAREFSFQGKKGQAVWVELFSHRLGLPDYPFLLVQRARRSDKGAVEYSDAQEIYPVEVNAGAPEINTAPGDPVGKVEIKEDGEYRVQVRDLFGTARPDPRRIFRLMLRAETPDFSLVVTPVPPPPAKPDPKTATVASASLRRGETWPVRVTALRRDGFSGAIDLSVADLPSGLTAGPARIEAGKNSGLILLTAAGDVPSAARPVRVEGSAMIADKKLVRQARGATVLWNVPDLNNEAVESRLTQDFVVGCTGQESAPISIAPSERKTWTLGSADKVKIPFTVTRRGEFTNDFKLKLTGLAALEGKEMEVGKTNSVAYEIDVAGQKIPPGRYIFHWETQVAGKDKARDLTVQIYSEPVVLEVAGPPPK